MNRRKDEIVEVEPYFSLWMERLTSENLHEKGDIAFELARLHKMLDVVVYGVDFERAIKDTQEFGKAEALLTGLAK